MSSKNVCIKTLNSIIDMVTAVSNQGTRQEEIAITPVKAIYGNEYSCLKIKGANEIDISIKKTGNIIMAVTYAGDPVQNLSRPGKAYSRSSNHKGAVRYTYGYAECAGGTSSKLYSDLQQIL